MGAALDYFNENVNRETDDCIVWKFNLNHKGYGLVYLKQKTQIVHGAALRLRVGERPVDKPLCLHKPLICHNRACFNYRHLYWGTYEDNKRDQVLDGTNLIGEKHGMHKLSNENVLSIMSDDRTHQAIADSYKVARSIVSKIKSGKSWKHLTCN